MLSPVFRTFTPSWVKEEERRLLLRTALYSLTQTDVTDSGIIRYISLACEIGIVKFSDGMEVDSNWTVPVEALSEKAEVALHSAIVAAMATRMVIRILFIIVLS